MICSRCNQEATSLHYPSGYTPGEGVCPECTRKERLARAEAVPADKRWRNTKAQREALKARFGGRCAYCGSELGNKWHADHMESVYRLPDGTMENPEHNTIDNMMPACVPCNLHKHGLTLEEWREYLQRSADILRRATSTFRAAERFGVITVNDGPIKFFFEKQRD